MAKNSRYLYEKDYNECKKFLEDITEDESTKKEIYELLRLGKKNIEQLRGEVFIENYEKYVNLITELIKDNLSLQYRVHELGIKNRIKKKLNRYKPPESVRNYITDQDLQSLKDSTILIKQITPLSRITAGLMEEKGSKFALNFEEGLEKIQNELEFPRLKKNPKVSIIIPTRNGLKHLTRLFENFTTYTVYQNYEIIVVDNDSKDATVEYLREKKSEGLNINIIGNKKNLSFSESNNIAAKKASGDYLLFLNNDVVPTHGWLTHLVNTALNNKDAGAVGAKLVYPYKDNFPNSNMIQHGGIIFTLEDNFIRPMNQHIGENFLKKGTTYEEEKIGVTAACMLLKKSTFFEVGCFDESYWYGYEDVDLCLKLNKLGYKNYINNGAVLYHYEFGTQEKNKSKEISSYRARNIELFKKKWQGYLYQKYWQTLLKEKNSGPNITEKKLKICFITTEAKNDTAVGDFFTAKELSISLEKIDVETCFIGMRDSARPFYVDDDVDVIISMIDGYDISKVTNKHAIKIAWCRNWFERWASHKYFREYDFVLTNSEKSQKYFKNEHLIESYLFKIATNKERFTKKYLESETKQYASDICFTGNYWHAPRDITKLFNPAAFADRNIKVFGKDWDKVKELAKYHQGYLSYSDIPMVYAAGKILIDDATDIVNKWGSVNSRVFDGAASGILVVSNGVEGGENTFDGILPTFESKEELTKLIDEYLNDEVKRNKKTKELKDYVLKHHTYDNRARELITILRNKLCKPILDIKLPIPNWEEASSWGDYHFGNSLKKSLEDEGYSVNLHILPEWHKGHFHRYSLVIRGLSIYEPRNEQINIIWHISHPDSVSLKEFEKYDFVFVASEKFCNELRKNNIDATTLYQCYDPELFAPPKKTKYDTDVLYVGNTRNKFRKSIKYLNSWEPISKYKIRVYGKGWENFIDDKYIAGEYVPNSLLSKTYSKAKILINDHWDDMNEQGFVSNRLFDAAGSKAFVISDKNSGIDEVFGENTVPQYSNEEELHNLLKLYLENDSEREKLKTKMHNIVVSKHTFKERAKKIKEAIERLP